MRELGVQPERGTDAAAVSAEHHGLAPCFPDRCHGENVHVRFFAAFRELLRVVEKIKVAVNVDQTRNPWLARNDRSACMPRAATDTNAARSIGSVGVGPPFITCNSFIGFRSKAA